MQNENYGRLLPCVLGLSLGLMAGCSSKSSPDNSSGNDSGASTPPGGGGPTGPAPTTGDATTALATAPATVLPPLPTLHDVVATEREDSVGIDFDPVDDAIDYRVYPLPKDSDVTINADNSLTIAECDLPVRRSEADLRPPERREQPERGRAHRSAAVREPEPAVLVGRLRSRRIRRSAMSTWCRALALSPYMRSPCIPRRTSWGGRRAARRFTLRARRPGRASSRAVAGTTASSSTCRRRPARRPPRSTTRRRPWCRGRATRSASASTTSRARTRRPTRATRSRRRPRSRC